MMLNVLPIKAGAKAPPLLQKWSEATPEKLEEVLLHHDDCNRGLRLDELLAFDPDNNALANYLNWLEKKGNLPPTWA